MNAAPFAGADGGTVFLLSSTTIDVLFNDTDSDGFIVPTTLQIVSAPPLGSASVVYVASKYQIRYTAPALTTGTTTLRYRVCDDDGACAQANLTITIFSLI
ncbi:MAG: Ig-like domain-containing protein [Acidimicrobiales bacterium]